MDPSFPRPGVYVTEHVPLLSVHVVELKVPDEAGESLNVTVPAGVKVVPGLESLMVAVQVAGAPTASGNGVQRSDVELLRMVEVTDAVLELPECAVSPGNVAVMVIAPSLPAPGV